MKNEYALITGASSGIGLEIAKRLASDGYNLVLTARRIELLEDLAREITQSTGVKVATISKDLSDANAPQEIYDFCQSKEYKVSVLINNAGYGIKTSFHQTTNLAKPHIGETTHLGIADVPRQTYIIQIS